MVKNLLTMQETRIQSLCQEDPLEENMAAHSNILARRIPMDRGKAAVHRVAKSQTGLKPPSTHTKVRRDGLSP